MKKSHVISSTKEGLVEFLNLLIAFIVILAVVYFSAVYDYTTSESSLIEISQELVVLLSSFIAFYQSKKNYKNNRILFLLSLLFLVMFIREMDYNIELFLPHGYWKYPAWCTIFVGLFYLWRNFDEVVYQFEDFSQEKEYSIFLIGLLMVLVYSRIAGMKEFWSITLDIKDSRHIKTLVEESLELLGYALIMTSLVFRKPVLND